MLPIRCERRSSHLYCGRVTHPRKSYPSILCPDRFWLHGKNFRVSSGLTLVLDGKIPSPRRIVCIPQTHQNIGLLGTSFFGLHRIKHHLTVDGSKIAE